MSDPTRSQDVLPNQPAALVRYHERFGRYTDVIYSGDSLEVLWANAAYGEDIQIHWSGDLDDV